MISNGLHLDLDGAWPVDELAHLGIASRDVREWGPNLRFATSNGLMEVFLREVRPFLQPFLLYGSGDFHHLAALWVRRFDAEPLHLVSFDNHPDWDTRPPRWCCGSWVSRVMELPHLASASIWGCGNFELEWPNRLFANRAALQSGRLHVYPWAERLKAQTARQWPSLTRENWRERFSASLEGIGDKPVYVTIDLDTLREADAATNWENGLFTADDLVWALDKLHRCTSVVGGDICGAWSAQEYARWPQRIAAHFDHPRRPSMTAQQAQMVNLRTLRTLWPALTGNDAAVQDAVTPSRQPVKLPAA